MKNKVRVIGTSHLHASYASSLHLKVDDVIVARAALHKGTMLPLSNCLLLQNWSKILVALCWLDHRLLICYFNRSLILRHIIAIVCGGVDVCAIPQMGNRTLGLIVIRHLHKLCREGCHIVWLGMSNIASMIHDRATSRLFLTGFACVLHAVSKVARCSLVGTFLIPHNISTFHVLVVGHACLGSLPH